MRKIKKKDEWKLALAKFIVFDCIQKAVEDVYGENSIFRQCEEFKNEK